jgi:hypothetical protein
MEQLISNAYNLATSANETYNRYRDRWNYLLESYMGGEDYRLGNHLTRYSLETDVEYGARLRATPLDNHCKSVIQVYTSFLFRSAVERDFGNLTMDPALEDFMYDADYDGRSFDSFMKEVSTWSSVFGHTFVMVAKPNIGANNRGEELAAGVRPYLSILTPLIVTDWSWARSSNGKYTLDRFKYVEDINGNVTVIKEWTNQTITTYIVDDDNKTVQEEIVEPNGLGLIPVIVCYNQRSPVRGLGLSDITDIADHQKKIFNELSEVEQSIRLNGHPALVKTPSVEAVGGAGAIVSMPEDLDPQLKPYLLDVSTDINQIYMSIQASVDAIDKMANIGAVRGTEARRMSGVAQEQEFQMLNARLSEKADNLELAEEQIWKLYAMYQGTVWNGYIDYPDSFNVKDDMGEIAKLKIAKETATDAMVFRMIDQRILEWMGEEEEMPESVEFEIHNMIDPVSGNITVVTTPQQHLDLVAQGYLEQGE